MFVNRLCDLNVYLGKRTVSLIPICQPGGALRPLFSIPPSQGCAPFSMTVSQLARLLVRAKLFRLTYHSFWVEDFRPASEG